VLADLRTAPGVNDAFGTSSYPGAVLYSSGDWISANRDTTARLARAITRTLAWMQTHTPQEIADKMGTTVGTTKWHMNQIFGKLQVHNRTTAIAKARDLRLL